MAALISQLLVYPIKSCGGVPVDRAELVPGGLRGDRRYMLVDEFGRFVTRRTEPRLCLVSVTWENERFTAHAPSAPPLFLPETFPEGAPPGPLVSTSVWSDSLKAREVSEGSAWFSSLLGRDVRLVYMPDEALRPLKPELSEPGDVVSFADGYPLLLCTESSLADLNDRLIEPIGMERFRPNVVISGTIAYEEDEWASVTLGPATFSVPKGCDRCVMTTLEEGTGLGSKEPLRTLATYRRWDGAVWFGINLIHRASAELQIGMPVSASSLRSSE